MRRWELVGETELLLRIAGHNPQPRLGRTDEEERQQSCGVRRSLPQCHRGLQRQSGQSWCPLHTNLPCHPQKPTAAVLLARDIPSNDENYSTERKTLIQKPPEPTACIALILAPHHPAHAGCQDQDAARRQLAGRVACSWSTIPLLALHHSASLMLPSICTACSVSGTAAG